MHTQKGKGASVIKSVERSPHTRCFLIFKPGWADPDKPNVGMRLCGTKRETCWEVSPTLINIHVLLLNAVHLCFVGRGSSSPDCFSTFIQQQILLEDWNLFISLFAPSFVACIHCSISSPLCYSSVCSIFYHFFHFPNMSRLISAPSGFSPFCFIICSTDLLHLHLIVPSCLPAVQKKLFLFQIVPFLVWDVCPCDFWSTLCFVNINFPAALDISAWVLLLSHVPQYTTTEPLNLNL